MHIILDISFIYNKYSHMPVSGCVCVCITSFCLARQNFALPAQPVGAVAVGVAPVQCGSLRHYCIIIIIYIIINFILYYCEFWAGIT